MNAWLYRKLLLLYPQDLRRQFGAEMMLAFAEDIKSMGAHRVWWCALRELLTVALPGQRSNPCVVVPVLSFVLAALSQAAWLWIALHRVAHVDNALLIDSIRLGVLLPSSLNAVVALVVTRVLAHYSITALQLD
jgi:hypothetical protein